MTPTSDDIKDLISYLGPEADEIAVISAVAHEGNDGYQLLKASVLIGPSEMGQTNWNGWKKQHGELEFPQEPLDPTYVTESGPLTIVRVVTDITTVSGWLGSLVETGISQGIAMVFPNVKAKLEKPVAPIRVSRNLETNASSFVHSAVRSATGFFFGAASTASVWDPDWGESVTPALLMTGLHLGQDLQGGVLLARLERRAWINWLRASTNMETLECNIGLEPARIDVADLVLSIEEWVSGEIVHSQQIKLEALPSVDAMRGKPHITVPVPTLGSQIQRLVRLYDRNGSLLDTTKLFWIVESIKMNLRVTTGDKVSEHVTMVGENRTLPSLVERADAIERVRAAYATLFTAGVEGTWVVPGSGVSAADAIAQRLSQARGVLHVVDRYFGKSPDDWKLFDQVTIPVQVLTSLGNAPPSPVPKIDVRWLKGKPAPFHGRAYLWDGGGLTVNASPNGFSGSPVLISYLDVAVSHKWLDYFAAWWSSASIKP